MIIGRSSIKSIKTYTQRIGLRKRRMVKVFIDYVISNLRWGFSIDGYVVKGNGFTMSKYEKKRFFTLRKAFWLQDHVNNPEYIRFLENKAEALNLFKDLVSRDWLYVPKSSFDDFKDFVIKTPVFIAKPVGGQEGEMREKPAQPRKKIGYKTSTE